MNLRSAPIPPPFVPPLAPARSRRFASMMYEGVLLFAVVFLADYLFDTLTQSKHGLMLRGARQAWLFFAIGVYFLICWARGGQTLPMKAWHIRLVALDGTPARLKQLGLRLILMWVLPLLGAAAVWGLSRATSWPSALMLIVVAPFTVLIPTWFTPQQQFLHDLLSGTRLINVAVSTNP
ncbi:MAG: RDD family protein [Zwartia sp.]